MEMLEEKRINLIFIISLIFAITHRIQQYLIVYNFSQYLYKINIVNGKR